jgi:hypothetical protein
MTGLGSTLARPPTVGMPPFAALRAKDRSRSAARRTTRRTTDGRTDDARRCSGPTHSVGCTAVEMITGVMPWPMYPNPMAAM